VTAREEILAVLPLVVSANGTFTVEQVMAEIRRRAAYAASTIRTHISSRMCANAPDNHAKTYHDVIRVAPGTYRVLR
jgi:hypothetical protein